MNFDQERLPREKVFRDPIHGQIIVDNQIILDLINTPEFQRLRRVKQQRPLSLPGGLRSCPPDLQPFPAQLPKSKEGRWPLGRS